MKEYQNSLGNKKMKKKVLKQIVLGIFLLLSYKMLAQSDSQKFKAFGMNPTIPNDSLFKQIQQATSFNEKYNATYNLIGFHQQKGNIDSIIYYSHNLYVETNKSELSNKEQLLSKACSTIGEGKLEKGLFDEALKWFLKGIEHSEKSFDDELYVQNKIGLGAVKFIRHKAEEGQKIIEECVDKAPNQELKHYALSELAFTNYSKGDYQKAKQNFEEVKLFYVAEGYVKKRLEVDLWLSKILDKQNKPKEALKLCYSVYNESLTNGFFTLYAKAGNVLGGFYLKEKDYENAKKILTTVYINSVQWGNLDIEKRAVTGLQKAHAETGDFKNSYALMTQLNRINNTLLVSQNKQQVNELEVQYKSLEQQQEISRQKTIKGNILIGFLILLVPVLGLLYMYYQKLQTQSKLNKTLEEVNQQKIASLLKNQELKLVKASLEGQNNERKRIASELHDSIGGNLATIKLQLSNDKKLLNNNLIKQVDDTYNQVRELSHNLMPKKFKNFAFTSIISKYINNVKNLSKEEITLQIHEEEKINKIEEGLQVELYKIIQELLTNALKHAKASQIDVQLSMFNNNIQLLFEDDGVGFDQEKVTFGIGFQSMKERLKKINGRILINAFPNRGTVIDIDVPLN